MGKGIGPIAEAEVVSAVWIILSQDKSSILLSNALSRILIFCCAIDEVIIFKITHGGGPLFKNDPNPSSYAK